MKICLVSDLHLDTRTGGYARHDDIEAALFDAVEFANEQSDLFICLGDVMDPDSGSCVFRCMRTLIEVTQRLRRPSIWLSGNHDVMEDGSGETVLEPLKRVGGPVLVIDEPQTFNPRGATGLPLDFSILAFPFTPFTRKYSPKAVLKEAMNGYDLHRPIDLVIGHLNVKGAMPGDETEMVRGREVWLPVKEIRAALGEVPIANGHIHKRQQTEDGVCIPGSLERLRFDEERHVTGWMEIIT